MRDESQVWLALLRRKGLSVTELAEQVGVTQQQVHELLTARAPAGADRARLEHALALGTRSPGRGKTEGRSPIAATGPRVTRVGLVYCDPGQARGET